MKYAFAIAALVATIAAAPAPGAITPSAVLGSAAALDGKTVTVSGTVGQYKTVRKMMTTYSEFQLCDAKGSPCIGVAQKGNAGLASGKSATITGTFHVHFSYHGHSGTNVLSIGM